MNRGRRPAIVSHSASYGIDRDFAPPESFRQRIEGLLGDEVSDERFDSVLEIIVRYREETADEQGSSTAVEAHAEAVRLRSAANRFAEALQAAASLPEDGGLARTIRLTANKHLRSVSTSFATGNFDDVVAGVRDVDGPYLDIVAEDAEAELAAMRARLVNVTLPGLQNLMSDVARAFETATLELAPSRAGRKMGQSWTEWIRRLANFWLAVTQTSPTAKKDPIDPDSPSRFVAFVRYLQRELQQAEDEFASTVQPAEVVPARRERQLKAAGFLNLDPGTDLSSNIARELERWRANPRTRGN